jgi:hypothetical protein
MAVILKFVNRWGVGVSMANEAITKAFWSVSDYRGFLSQSLKKGKEPLIRIQRRKTHYLNFDKEDLKR